MEYSNILINFMSVGKIIRVLCSWLAKLDVAANLDTL